MLGGHMGGTFSPKLVTRAYFLIIFGTGLIFDSFFDPNYDRELRSVIKVCGNGEPSGGGEASLQALCQEF